MKQVAPAPPDLPAPPLLVPRPRLMQDPILRYGGMFVIGLAYRGTANNAAIQKLLHFAVSGGWAPPPLCPFPPLLPPPQLDCSSLEPCP